MGLTSMEFILISRTCSCPVCIMRLNESLTVPLQWFVMNSELITRMLPCCITFLCFYDEGD